MSSFIRNPFKTRAAQMLLALAVLGLAQGPAVARTVDPKASSIVRADPGALGFDPARLDVARQALAADVASGKIAGAHLLVGRRRLQRYQRQHGQ